MHISTLSPSALQALPPSTVEENIKERKEETGRQTRKEYLASVGLVYLLCKFESLLKTKHSTRMMF